MATVLHGRRKGKTRSAPSMTKQMAGVDLNEDQDVTRGMSIGGTQMDINDLRQVTIFSKQDWNRINQQLNRRTLQQEEARRRKEQKAALKLKSKEMVKDWANTIAGQRQKRLEARAIREAKEEEERKVIDIEEAMFQAQKRKEAINKAKTQQYYQTDRVKTFHSALKLTEVLKEREAQIELNRMKALATDGQDKEYLERARQEYEDAIIEDQMNAVKRYDERQSNAEFQTSQIKEHFKQKLKDQVEDKDEGEELKKLAIQHQIDKKRLEDIRRSEMKENMSENMKQIGDVKKMKLIQSEQEEEEDEECRIFAAAKRKMMKLRAAKEKQLHIEKQERLQRIREKLSAQMKQMKDDEDIRIIKAVEESELKYQQEEQEKEQKVHKAKKGIAEHRHLQMHEAEQKTTIERNIELEMLKSRKEADLIFQRNEQEKASKRYDNNKALSGFHLNQLDELKRKEVAARQEQLAQDDKNMELLEIEENQFQEYADKVIGHCQSGGRNTYPLHKAAHAGAGGGLGPQFMGKGGIRPSYMVQDKSGVQLPLYQKESTEAIKRNIHGKSDTAKRMGFVF